MEDLALLGILAIVGVYAYYYYTHKDTITNTEHIWFAIAIVTSIGVYVCLKQNKKNNKNNLESMSSTESGSQTRLNMRNPIYHGSSPPHPSTSMPNPMMNGDVNMPSDETPYGRVELINYHTRWCPASVAFLPTWNELANLVTKEWPFIRVQDKVCEGEEKYSCDAMGVTAYPKIVLYIGDLALPYEADRNIVAMMTFIRNNLATAGIY